MATTLLDVKYVNRHDIAGMQDEIRRALADGPRDLGGIHDVLLDALNPEPGIVVWDDRYLTLSLVWGMVVCGDVVVSGAKPWFSYSLRPTANGGQQ